MANYVLLPCAIAIIVFAIVLYLGGEKKKTCTTNCTTWNNTYIAMFVMIIVCALSVMGGAFIG